MIDEKILEQARNADIVAFLEKYHGFTFATMGGAYRCKQHPSLAVKDNRLSWYWHSKGIGGFGALDYLIKVENMLFRDALEAVAGIAPTPIRPRKPQQEEKPKTLILPDRNTSDFTGEHGSPLQLYNKKRLYDYLCNKRGIDSDIVNTLIKKNMLYEDKRGNVVFVGYDEQDKPRFASLRSTHGDFRGDCTGSDKRYGFNMAFSQSERLYIFESPIDAMSHASLEKSTWKQHNRLSLSGTSDSALPFFLNKHNYTKGLIFCLDNDTAGREAAVNMARKYAEKYYTRLELPTGKDFNEDLVTIISKKSQKYNSKNDICL